MHVFLPWCSFAAMPLHVHAAIQSLALSSIQHPDLCWVDIVTTVTVIQCRKWRQWHELHGVPKQIKSKLPNACCVYDAHFFKFHFLLSSHCQSSWLVFNLIWSKLITYASYLTMRHSMIMIDGPIMRRSRAFTFYSFLYLASYLWHSFLLIPHL